MPRLPETSSGAAAVFDGLLEARTGQRLGPARQWRLETALSPLLRQVGAASLDGLAKLVLAGATPRLADRVVDALLNGESSFFRDPVAFELVRQVLTDAGARPLRIWSAGCSSGQEPLSLAILAAEVGVTTEIVASDVSAGAIARARTGRFSSFEIQRGLSVHRMIRWFEPDGDDWVARPELLATVRFRVASLLEPVPAASGCDLVLCRNVLFYLSPPARQVAVGRLRSALASGGLLLLGAGETMLGDGGGFIASPRVRGAYEGAEPGLVARGRAA